MKTLTQHQIAGNKSFIFVMVCHTVLQSNEHQTEAALFHCKTVVVVVCFFRLFSAVLNKSRHWVKKIASKCMQYPTHKQKNKKKVTDFAMPFIMELILLSQILSPDGSTPMHKIYFTRNSCRFA